MDRIVFSALHLDRETSPIMLNQKINLSPLLTIVVIKVITPGMKLLCNCILNFAPKFISIPLSRSFSFVALPYNVLKSHTSERKSLKRLFFLLISSGMAGLVVLNTGMATPAEESQRKESSYLSNLRFLSRSVKIKRLFFGVKLSENEIICPDKLKFLFLLITGEIDLVLLDYLLMDLCDIHKIPCVNK